MTAPVPSWEVIADTGPVTFTVDDATFTIAELPLRVWGPALTSGDLEDVIPGLLPDAEQEAWAEVFWDDRRVFSRDLHQRIVYAVIDAASGLPWAACLNLLATARAHWRELDGWATAEGLDLLGLPLHRFCNLLYHRITSNMAEKDRVTFDADLFAPPPGADPDSPDAPPGWDDADTGGLFAAALTGFEAAKARTGPQVR